MQAPAAPTIEPLPRGLAKALARAGTCAPVGVEHIQTHISHVFLTRDRVYKLRKAVDLGFVTFATREQRNADCLSELALNRRLAPSVYLGVAPLLHDRGSWRIGPTGEDLVEGAPPPEHCVVMRRLPEGGDALSRLRAGTLSPAHIDAVARRLVRFHASHGLGQPAPFAPREWMDMVRAPAETNFRVLGELALPDVPVAWVERVADAATRRFDHGAGRFETRRVQGRAVDGHGDVHLEHVWFEGASRSPLLIDCIEFNAGLRRIDAASEVAFLAMDCAYRGRCDLAERFLRTYAAESDDFGLYTVIDDYVSYRAAVRAKVAALVAADGAIDASRRSAAAKSAARHLELSELSLAHRPPGAVVVLCGTVGGGKSTVAAAIADETRGVVISSDRTRKRLAGIGPTDRLTAAPDQGGYAPERTDAVYRCLLERAGHVVASGRVAILDATFAQRRRRRRALDWSADHAGGALLVQVSCSPALALERLRLRQAEGDDASDAGPDLLEHSLRGFEPPDDWPQERRLRVDTSVEWRPALVDGLRERQLTGFHRLPSRPMTP